jgi:hypothetical protein
MMTAKPKTRPELEAIAFEMRARLCETDLPTWRTSSGIELALKCQRGGYLLLTIKRIEQGPTPAEVAAIRAAFEVPETATVRAFARQMISWKTHAYVWYRGVELRWWESDGAGAAATDEPAAAGAWTGAELRDIRDFVKRLAGERE